jgi:hypothetical protein
VTKNLSVMWTDEMYEDMKILKEAHGDQSEATRWAFKIAANILEYAWLFGHADRGEVPEMRVQFKAKDDHGEA